MAKYKIKKFCRADAIHAGCFDCDKEWRSSNCQGVAAKHAMDHGHRTWADVSISCSYDPIIEGEEK